MTEQDPAAGSGSGAAPLVVGKAVRAHGITGEVKVRLWSHDPAVHADRKQYWVRRDAGWERLAVTASRPHQDGLLVRFAGIKDRNAAEAFVGTDLFLYREEFPPLDDGEFYWADLVGLAVLPWRDGVVDMLGTVREVFDTGANAVLLVELDGGRRANVPFTREAVGPVDLAARTVRVAPDWLE